MLKKHKQQTGTDADTVLDQIERVVHWSDEFRFAFVKCNHPVQREAMRHSLLDRLSDKHVLEVFLEKPIISLLDELSARWDATQPPDAVCVYGLENSLGEQRETSPLLGRLNHDRDLIRQAIPAALLIWLPDFALDYVARGAPDFWAWRSGVYEFPTEVSSWQRESVAVFARGPISLFSLPLEDKQKEIARLEELLWTAQTLPQRDRRVQGTNAHLLDQLGLLYRSLGRWQEALEQYQQSLKIAEDLGDRANVAVSFHQIGLIHQDRGEYAAALANYEQALKIAEALGDQAGVAASLNQIGLIHQTRGEYAAAMAKYEQALNIFEVLGDQAGVATSLHEIGNLHYLHREYAAAMVNYEQALKIAERLGDQASVANLHGQIGQLFTQNGRYAEAFEHLLIALRTFEKLQSPDAGIAVNALKELRARWGEKEFDTAWREVTGKEAVPNRLK